jgi:hypothetical protein
VQRLPFDRDSREVNGEMSQSAIISDSIHPRPAPIEFSGQWVAWNRQRTQIIAHGPTMASVHAATIADGHVNAILQRVRRLDERIIGTT